MRRQKTPGTSSRSHQAFIGGQARLGDEDAGVQPVEVGERLVDVGRAGEFREAEQHVDRLHHERVGVEEDDLLVVGELPQLELAEIVDRVVEGRLVALVEGRGAMQRLAAVALLEIGGDAAAG